MISSTTTITKPKNMLLKITGLLFVVAALVSLVFGILGHAGIGLPDTFYLGNAISEARTLNANQDGVPMWTEESWRNLQESLVTARTVFNDRAANQEQINSAYVGLRSALGTMVPSEAFADMEVAAYVPGERAVPALFTYLILLFIVLGASGALAIIYNANVKKMFMLGACGIVSFAAMVAFIFFAVDTLGYEVFYVVLPTVILPIAYLVGVVMGNRRTSIVIIFGILVAMAAFVLFPLWWIIRSSLMYLHEVPSMSFLPNNWVFSNYPRALERFLYFTYLRNTFIIAIPAVTLGTCTAILCAYSFARLRFRGKKFVFGLCIASMLLPPVVTLIPQFIMFTNFFGLTNTFWPLIIPWICGGGAFNIFL